MYIGHKIPFISVALLSQSSSLFSGFKMFLFYSFIFIFIFISIFFDI